MKKIFIISTIALSTIYYGQTMINNVNDFYTTAMNNGTINNSSGENVSGTPYLTNDYIVTKISSLDSSISARYNIYKDEVEFKKNNNIYLVPKTDSYSKISFSNGTNLTLINNNYYIINFQQGKNMILKKEKIKYNPAIEAKSSYQEAKPASYVKTNPQFFINTDSGPIEITKDNLIKSFPNKDIKSFLNKNKLNLKNENELIKLGQFIFN
ncbi:hypothetical protein CMU89_13175 [Elizabethkingia anophelis]|uniref:Uncharacterized protein n=1 Tax=Elizabethkingia anophelis TaxID=1117645 RepID=A0AAE4P3A4_9FLAO|nr:hypothetical protein [Elizabethkingia anophelis]AKH96013.1 hypothetical protein M876_15770 [Elizabethkingia anophelis FMS-007]AQW94149.1 hypothetical protein BBD30_08025 [Elizabethkingia anophelis]MCT3760881.1 hypothetical protein [Elizabethkingia anophelis]MCT3919538.1 hypothetical protein [Elizabethkingia anophelis]MCT3951893.1 hypothetical protein [Elizabethkingia anophelis]